MALTQEQADRFWRVFAGKPPIAKWSDFQTSFLRELNTFPCVPGQCVFQSGLAPSFLFMVGEGTIEQVVAKDGRIWLRQELGPGTFFGQQALFTGEYEATATALTAVTLYTMTAADLRIGMERDAGLFDALVRENLAGRLRRIPLFRSLNDAEMRWLAQVIEERDLAQGSPVPVTTEPGLWVVDWGQVEVTGPANPHEGRWPKWGLTSGSFFVAPGQAAAGSAPAGGPAGLAQAGAAWVADSATTTLKSHLFYLPVRHAEPLIATFPDVRERLRTTLDIADKLSRVELFRSLSDEQREHLAQYCGWEFAPAGQNITTQGNVGHSFVILVDGAAVVSALDERGKLRPRNRLVAGDAYGETSLLEGKQRDATVRAVIAQASAGGRAGLGGSEQLLLDRRDMHYAFPKEHRLWGRNVSLVQRYQEIREERKAYEWMQEGEKLRWRDRGHIFWLLTPELGVVAVLLALILAIKLALSPDVQPQFWIAFVILPLPLALIFAGWFYYNYHDDYYAITNRRVTRRDHLLLLYESRQEAPVEMVQDVTVDAGFWGRLFDFGNVTIRTAAKIGAIVFAHVPAPDTVRDRILQERTEAVIALRGQQKEQLRRGLMTELRLALPIPQRMRALGDDAKSDETPGWWRRFRAWWQRQSQPRIVQPRVRRSKPGWFIQLTSGLPPRWQKAFIGPTPPPPPTPMTGMIQWRKHWLSLVERAGLPFLMTAFLIVAAFLLIAGETDVAGFHRGAFFVPWLFAMIFAAGWLWWQVTDYYNDLYILTDDKIIDIEAKPLGLFMKRREGNLERVQTVDFKQVGLAAYIFNYGNVIIRTAAADEGYDFVMVPNPKLVQATVFQKLDALRGKQEAKKTQDRQQELIEGLDVYHQLREEQSARERR
ncbi:MAG: cyclic nucleotide-binding domain-containing protein [Chloroflexi bacterium]|nr:cyclic nucleotide-binding domain-containing protein [Chloroflexota bacterium]